MKNKISDLKHKDNILLGFFRGIVEDRNDPEKLGRCRIRVFGVHTGIKTQSQTEGIPTDHLPWAQPVTSLVEGGTSGFGLWTVPLQGSQVLVFFEDGNIMQPRYMGSLPGKTESSSKGKGNSGFTDPEEKYPTDSKSFPHAPNQKGDGDIHKLATGDGTSDTIVKSKTDKKVKNVGTTDPYITWDEPDPYYGAKYPDNIVFSTHSGITIEVDNTAGQERIHIYHPSNSYIEIGPKGDIVIRNAKDKFELVDDNKKVKIGGNLDTSIMKSETNFVNQDKVEKININITEDIGNNKIENIGNNKIENIGNTHTINAKSETINAKDITLNGNVTITGTLTVVAGGLSVNENGSVLDNNLIVNDDLTVNGTLHGG